MATINSAGSGNWHTAGTWVGGAVPGTGDTANILTGHTVTIAAPLLAIAKIIVTGNLVMNADITMDNAVQCHITIYDGGTFTSNGSPLSPRYIKQKDMGTSTNQWYFNIRHSAGVPKRVINLNNIVMSGNWWYLGESTTTGEFLSFNVITDATRIMLRPSPVVRDVSIIEHLIDGRAMGRVYPRGNNAGRCTVRGYLPHGSLGYVGVLEGLKNTARRVGLTTDIVHMGSARVESLRWGEVKGNNLPFTMVLVEDL